MDNTTPIIAAMGAGGASLAATGTALDIPWGLPIGGSLFGIALFLMLGFIVSNTQHR